MSFITFHKSFKLNEVSFADINEILIYTEKQDFEAYQFLKDWFSESKCISVQTSGSTGTPKIISLKKEQMINSALATGNFFNLKENTKALLCLSTAYIAGKMMLVRALTLGWEIDVVKTESNPLISIEKKYDFSAMVPLQLENSIDKLHQIKTLIVGGGVVSSSLQQRIQTSVCNIYATYGMTETITHVAIKKLNNNSVTPNFYTVLPNVNIYIDEKSCLVINAPKVSDDLVFTNDVVQLISDNQFNWLGRFDNVINSGGVKLFPEKIEEKLSKILDSRFFVAGISDEKLGEKLILIIEGKKHNVDLSSCNLSKFEKPKSVYFIDKFVETDTKKIQRNRTIKIIEL